ncbi:hypothetical protein NLG97_g12 [Lecanicillium saksenae]|uniref:Uncharacterized protein n=1 Tax=Lecanicillium saksenae TaxID=468837 RepID=A0ACC1R9J7_9HYPO|nr:hypothetical protein NLG97_g12 [Lecanicillium saksenae]
MFDLTIRRTMEPKVQGPIVMITGCRSGIGKSLASAFAFRGAHVLATARQASQLQDLCAEHANITALSLDLDRPEDINHLHTAVQELTGGKIDFLINNAGLHYSALAMDLDMEEVHKVFSVNVFSVMRLCSAFLPMLRRGEHRNRAIVQIGSVTRDIPVVWQSAYNASKAALSQYTKTLRLEVKPLNISVVEVVTGFVQSDILRHGFYPPSNSLYIPVQEQMEKIKLHGNASGMAAGKYAGSIAEKLLATKRFPTSEVWQGTLAWKLRLAVAICPLWLLAELRCGHATL